MTVLHCTVRQLKHLHQLAKPPSFRQQANPLGEWYADLNSWPRRPFVIMLNVATGAMLVLPGEAGSMSAISNCPQIDRPRPLIPRRTAA